MLPKLERLRVDKGHGGKAMDLSLPETRMLIPRSGWGRRFTHCRFWGGGQGDLFTTWKIKSLKKKNVCVYISVLTQHNSLRYHRQMLLLQGLSISSPPGSEWAEGRDGTQGRITTKVCLRDGYGHWARKRGTSLVHKGGSLSPWEMEGEEIWACPLICVCVCLGVHEIRHTWKTTKSQHWTRPGRASNTNVLPCPQISLTILTPNPEEHGGMLFKKTFLEFST